MSNDILPMASQIFAMLCLFEEHAGGHPAQNPLLAGRKSSPTSIRKDARENGHRNWRSKGFPKGSLYARPLHLFRRLAHVRQFPFDCLLPLSHFSPPGGHVKVGRPDVWVGYSRCGALAFVRLPLIGVSPIQAHDLAPQSGSQGKH